MNENKLKDKKPDLQIESSNLFVNDTGPTDVKKVKEIRKFIDKNYNAIYLSDIKKTLSSQPQLRQDYFIESLIHKWCDAVVVLIHNENTESDLRDDKVSSIAALNTSVGGDLQSKFVITIPLDAAYDEASFINEFDMRLTKKVVDKYESKLTKALKTKISLFKMPEDALTSVKLNNEGDIVKRLVNP